MNAHIYLDVLIVLLSILLLRWMLKLKPQAARLGSQRMCPSCGLITSRFKTNCLECGKPLAVVYAASEK
jgi:hypothetical protein